MEELLDIIKQQASVNQQLTNELALLREQVAYLTQKDLAFSLNLSAFVSNDFSINWVSHPLLQLTVLRQRD